ncbi:hypothetical protein JCM11957_07630 [Caminibacter profundus]
MRKILFFIPFFVYAGILSEIKQKEIDFDRLKTIKDSQETKKSWINPIIFQYSYQKDNTLGYQTTTNLFSISINQPIFKSGAIYYSIKYANLSKKYNLDQVELQKRALIKKALDLVYDYKISKLNEKIVKLKIKNAKIDVKRKKEAFLSGSGDSSLLDNAILGLNSLKLSLEDIRTNINQIKYSFANLSDLNIDNVKLPHFKLISKDKFLNENIELNSQKIYKKIKNYLYKMQVGNQLLTVSFNGSYNYKETENKKIDKQNYYIVGISASVPLDVNAKTKIEKTKIDYLKSQVLLQDKIKELVNNYKMTIEKINSLKNKLKIYDENVKIYNSLINSTQESIKAGTSTLLDLEVLQNSKMQAVLNKRIVELQIQKTLLELYYKLNNFYKK